MSPRMAWGWMAVTGALLVCGGCGFKGPLYLPERNVTVVTHQNPGQNSGKNKAKTSSSPSSSAAAPQRNPPPPLPPPQSPPPENPPP